ncbi:uncharacterized protein CANTADRAFT_57717 [Suhomyces tanzawaensis NRRL Y-17324]|uniref:Uncharacterized protein n=1 Tax=Suhomyces tanzawaensis NRRL Y-17324 TaxID=984487 RepID=A0A1E4SBC4_9ASCO|nr:uncharacterized protein CANTADRAFT_57717 [Suhomyces tanzawaensis NRRL Y-17324]ODV76803.1 hypothetical protein CANTADRAFT_57717 [Suhomyces tanzawaensis NRRL Y-17324]
MDISSNDGYESTPPTEVDISSIIKEQGLSKTDSKEQQEFNGLSKHHKFERLNNLIQKSQVYSQIIADNILQRSLNLNNVRDDNQSNEQKEPSKKKRKIKKQQDITTMLSSNIAGSTKATRQAIEDSQTKALMSQPKLVTGGTLKDYQLEGLQWLSTLFENGLNGILADEMGLGKTLQCISFLAFLIEQGIKGPFLIVVPLSTVSNWVNEVRRFAPEIKIFKYSGSKEERSSINIKNLVSKEKTNIIVTSYEISIRDFKKFNLINWSYLIVDEGHRLKNNDCTLIRFLKKLNVSNRLLITGTPLQNNLNELWSLLNFILPDIFHDLELFQQWFNFDELTKFENDDQDGTDEETRRLIKLNIQENLVKNLHTILKPFILRRLKRDVIKSLPPKKEYLIHIPLTPLQRKLYQDALDNKLSSGLIEIAMKEYINYNYPKEFKTKQDYALIDKFLLREPNLDTTSKSQNYKEAESDDEFELAVVPAPVPTTKENDNSSLESVLKQKNLPKSKKQDLILRLVYSKIIKDINNLSLQNSMMQLRNICNSPYIYYEPFDHSEGKLTDEKQFMKILYKNSAKIQVLDQLCTELMLKKHKVLIFSQFTKLLDLLHDWFNYKKIQVSRIDGSYSQGDRDNEIKRFNEDSTTPIFLLSTRAGGLGINLTASDSVILFDNDWNPQMDLQAIDRVHRIGQTKPVKIFRFLVKNSIEEILISKSSSKRFLEKLVIQMGEFKFQKLKKIIEENDRNSNTLIDVKSMLEFSKSSFKLYGEIESDDNVPSYEYSFGSDKEVIFRLTKNEIKELLDRSELSYQRENIVNLRNVSSFETLNNMDK